MARKWSVRVQRSMGLEDAFRVRSKINEASGKPGYTAAQAILIGTGREDLNQPLDPSKNPQRVICAISRLSRATALCRTGGTSTLASWPAMAYPSTISSKHNRGEVLARSSSRLARISTRNRCLAIHRGIGQYGWGAAFLQSGFTRPAKHLDMNDG